MPPEIPIVADAEALCRAGAAAFVRQAGGAVRAKGACTVALSGGSTPKGLDGLLASAPTLRAQVPWERIHLFWGDERHVPPITRTALTAWRTRRGCRKPPSRPPMSSVRATGGCCGSWTGRLLACCTRDS